MSGYVVAGNTVSSASSARLGRSVETCGSSGAKGSTYSRIFGFWSAKGGVGTSTTASICALGLGKEAKRAQKNGEPYGVLLVDLGCDIADILGCDNSTSVGLAEWSRSEPRDIDALERICTPVGSGITLLRRGQGSFGIPPADLVEELRYLGQDVVLDLGTIISPDDAANSFSSQDISQTCAQSHDAYWRAELLDCVDIDLLVTRNCYLCLKRFKELGRSAGSVVLLRERGRSISCADVEIVAKANAVAEIDIDQRVYRCVDAGLLSARLPKRLLSVVSSGVSRALEVSAGVAA